MRSLSVFYRRLLYTLALLGIWATAAAAQQTEPAELYGYNEYAFPHPSYFRVHLPSVTAVAIGPDAFPFPLGPSCDLRNRISYSIVRDNDGNGSLWATSTQTGASRYVGPTGQRFASDPTVVYNAGDAGLYAFEREGNALGKLYEVEAAWGLATLLDSVAFPDNTAPGPITLWGDPTSRTLYGTDALGTIFEISIADHPFTVTILGSLGGSPPAYTPPALARFGGCFYGLSYAHTTQEGMPRLLGFATSGGNDNQPSAGVLTLSLLVNGLDAAPLPHIDGLFAAASETGDLYGYGSDAEGRFTYFRFNLEAAAFAEEISPDAFPLPLDSASDPVHDLRYRITTEYANSYIGDASTLFVTEGRTGQINTLGTLSHAVEPDSPISTAYQSSTGLLYAIGFGDSSSASLWQVNPSSLQAQVLTGLPNPGWISGTCWNPHSGALYGVHTVGLDVSSVNPFGAEIAEVLIPSATNQDPSLDLTKLAGKGWSFYSCAIDPSGRYFYGVGNQSTDQGGYQGWHLFIYDFDRGGLGVFAPVVGAYPNFPPAIYTIFFASPR